MGDLQAGADEDEVALDELDSLGRHKGHALEKIELEASIRKWHCTLWRDPCFDSLRREFFSARQRVSESSSGCDVTATRKQGRRGFTFNSIVARPCLLGSYKLFLFTSYSNSHCIPSFSFRTSSHLISRLILASTCLTPFKSLRDQKTCQRTWKTAKVNVVRRSTIKSVF